LMKMTASVTAVYEKGIFKPMGKVNLKEHEKVKLIIKPTELTGSAGIAVMSESSLKKDWLKTEEDEAWKDL